MNTLKTILSGLAVGGAMTIPGVSGGSAAMILGIYDDLITAVSHAFSEPRKNLLLLLKFAVGACAGALLIARLITFLLTTPVEVPLRFLFLGAVAGGIPMIFRKAEIRKLTAGSTALILAGVGVVMLISMLPERIFSPDTSGFAAVIMQFLGGLLLAAALVLPGISASHFLLMLGIYDDVMEKLGEFELLALVPLAAGAAVGVFLTAKVLERLLGLHPRGTYLVILGFMLGSLRAERGSLRRGSVPCRNHGGSVHQRNGWLRRKVHAGHSYAQALLRQQQREHPRKLQRECPDAAEARILPQSVRKTGTRRTGAQSHDKL